MRLSQTKCSLCGGGAVDFPFTVKEILVIGGCCGKEIFLQECCLWETAPVNGPIATYTLVASTDLNRFKKNKKNPSYFLRYILSLYLKLAICAMLSSKQVPGIHLSLPYKPEVTGTCNYVQLLHWCQLYVLIFSYNVSCSCTSPCFNMSAMIFQKKMTGTRWQKCFMGTPKSYASLKSHLDIFRP